MLFLVLTSSVGFAQAIQVGAAQLDELLPKLKDQRVALLVNQTFTVGKTHLVDSFQKRGIIIKKIFLWAWCHLIQLYIQFPDIEKFFIPYFDKLAGNKMLKEQIKKGMTESQIRASWKAQLKS